MFELNRIFKCQPTNYITFKIIVYFCKVDSKLRVYFDLSLDDQPANWLQVIITVLTKTFNDLPLQEMLYSFIVGNLFVWFHSNQHLVGNGLKFTHKKWNGFLCSVSFYCTFSLMPSYLYARYHHHKLCRFYVDVSFPQIKPAALSSMKRNVFYYRRNKIKQKLKI